ncbi:hypothetical protein GCM10009539_73750 [Cryptosporangium japonicum]|uniref:Uncharacterized protein n=1 Tax=Cryptosporangium japonicum TaxID=80872 RepID=A0ABP3EUX8_9ACTN
MSVLVVTGQSPAFVLLVPPQRRDRTIGAEPDCFGHVLPAEVGICTYTRSRTGRTLQRHACA